MKKLLNLLFALLACLTLQAQVKDQIVTPPIPGSGSNRNNQALHYANAAFDLNLRVPRTLNWTLNGAKDSIGYVMFNTTLNKLGVYVGNGVWNTLLNQDIFSQSNNWTAGQTFPTISSNTYGFNNTGFYLGQNSGTVSFGGTGFYQLEVPQLHFGSGNNGVFGTANGLEKRTNNGATVDPYITQSQLPVFTETEPAYNGSYAKTITPAFFTPGNTAFSWGNHAGLYPLLTGIYNNPSWISSLPASKITGLGTASLNNQDQSISGLSILQRTSDGSAQVRDLYLGYASNNLSALLSQKLNKSDVGSAAYNNTGDFFPRPVTFFGNTDISTALATGVYRNENGLGGNQPYAPVLSLNAGDVGMQISGGFNTDNFQVRNWYSSGANFTPWRLLWHSGNFNPANYALISSLGSNAFNSIPYYPNSNPNRYISGYIETSTFQDVTNRGNTTSLSVNAGSFHSENDNVLGAGSYSSNAFESRVSAAGYAAGARPGYGFHAAGNYGLYLYANNINELRFRESNSTLDYHLWTDADFTLIDINNWRTVGTGSTLQNNIFGNSATSNRAIIAGNFDNQANSATIGADINASGLSLAQRNPDGDINARYLHVQTPLNDGVALTDIIGTGGDGYLRRYSFDVLKSGLGLNSAAYQPLSAFLPSTYVAPVQPTGSYPGITVGNATHSNNSDNSTNSTNASFVANGSANMQFNWSGQSGQPTWVWGGNAPGQMYVYNPGNFNVSHALNADNATNSTYATTAGTANSVAYTNIVGRFTNLSQFTNDLNLDARYQPLENQRLSTVNGVTFAGLSINSVLSPTSQATNGQTEDTGTGLSLQDRTHPYTYHGQTEIRYYDVGKFPDNSTFHRYFGAVNHFTDMDGNDFITHYASGNSTTIGNLYVSTINGSPYSVNSYPAGSSTVYGLKATISVNAGQTTVTIPHNLPNISSFSVPVMTPGNSLARTNNAFATIDGTNVYLSYASGLAAGSYVYNIIIYPLAP